MPGHTQSEDERVHLLVLFEVALGRAPWSRSGPITRVSAWGPGARPPGEASLDWGGQAAALGAGGADRLPTGV